MLTACDASPKPQYGNNEFRLLHCQLSQQCLPRVRGRPELRPVRNKLALCIRSLQATISTYRYSFRNNIATAQSWSKAYAPAARHRNAWTFAALACKMHAYSRPTGAGSTHVSIHVYSSATAAPRGADGRFGGGIKTRHPTQGIRAGASGMVVGELPQRHKPFIRGRVSEERKRIPRKKCTKQSGLTGNLGKSIRNREPPNAVVTHTRQSDPWATADAPTSTPLAPPSLRRRHRQPETKVVPRPVGAHVLSRDRAAKTLPMAAHQWTRGEDAP